MLKNFAAFFKKILVYRPDGAIISDPYILTQVRKIAPKLPIHISTQQSVTNSKASLFFARNGAKRIILSREVAFSECQPLLKNVKKQIEIETFIHGAVCIGYSGRCMLSNNCCLRDSNIGGCAQCCR
jgi:putative protease